MSRITELSIRFYPGFTDVSPKGKKMNFFFRIKNILFFTCAWPKITESPPEYVKNSRSLIFGE